MVEGSSCVWRVRRLLLLPAPPRWKLTGWRFPAGSMMQADAPQPSATKIVRFSSARSAYLQDKILSEKRLIAKQDPKSNAKEYLQLIAKGDQMGAALSTGIEIDPQAVGSARENMLLNGMDSNKMLVYLIDTGAKPSCFSSIIDKSKERRPSSIELKSSRGT